MANLVMEKGKTVVNWSNTFACSPEFYVEPEDINQLREVLEYATRNSRKVKVVGTRHSPSDIAFTSEIMVDLKRMNKVLQVNEHKLQVTVESGIMLSDLNAFLTSKGLALSVLPAISDFTVGGCISVATHGSGIKFGTMSSLAVDLELMASDGSLHFCSLEDNSNLFRAASCGLGAIGILTKITLQCERSFNLVQLQYGEKLSETLDKLDHYLETSDHFKFCWYPHTDNTIVFLIDRLNREDVSKKRVNTIPLSAWRRFFIWFWEKYFLEFLYWISLFLPTLTLYINALSHWLYSAPVEFEDVSSDVFNFDCLFKQYVSDYAIPLENTKEAILELKNWVDRASSISVAHAPVEIRFVKADTSFLSPTAGRNSTYINIIMFRPYGRGIEKQKYWNAYEEIMERHGGRPHWAKEHKITARQLKTMYPDFKTWCQIREQVDPAGIFINGYLKRLLEC